MERIDWVSEDNTHYEALYDPSIKTHEWAYLSTLVTSIHELFSALILLVLYVAMIEMSSPCVFSCTMFWRLWNFQEVVHHNSM